MAAYIEHLERKLHDIDYGIERAKAAFERSAAAEKQKALAELSTLRVRHDELAERIEEAKTKGSEHWSAVRTGLQEEADGLNDTIESLLTRISWE
jgi:uncharacterized coiled-coil DUF342 family protein